MTVNYEVDKTIRYVQQPMGGLKRLSVAVVVNYKREVDKAGKVTTKPLSDEEKTQITDLVKETMGYNKDRGDTLNVVNSPFASAEKETIAEVPVWKRPESLLLAKDIGKYLIGGAILLYLFFGILKPMLTRLSKNLSRPAAPAYDEAAVAHIPVEPMGQQPRGYQENLEAAKQLARQDPKVVANVVKGWVGTGNE